MQLNVLKRRICGIARSALGFISMLSVIVLLFAHPTYADMCVEVRDRQADRESEVEERHHRKIFSSRAYHGNRDYNELIIQCNRKRDSNGKQVKKIFGQSDEAGFYSLLDEESLDWKIIRGNFDFYGAVPFSYVYLLSKKNGVWQVVIPYKAKIRDVSPGRVDLLVGERKVLDGASGRIAKNDRTGPANLFYEESEVKYSTVAGPASYILEPGAKSIFDTLCKESIYLKKPDAYEGKSGFNSSKRDRTNRHITLGRIQYRYASQDSSKTDNFSPVVEGCRVNKQDSLFFADPDYPPGPNGEIFARRVSPGDWVLQNFIKVSEEFWSRPKDFRLRLWLKGFNDEDIHQNIRRRFEPDDDINVNFATKFMRADNQMYKANAYQYNNFSTMTTDGTYLHEVGHALGLDDEYGANWDIGVTELRDGAHCNDGSYNIWGSPLPEDYMMCDGYEDEEVTTVYQYIAVSRYGTRQRECRQDSQCNAGEWCDAGIDLKRNVCRAKRADSASCPLVNGGRTCQSGHCRFGQCYTPKSVEIGGQCFTQDQCAQGKCNNAVDGLPGTCVCKEDRDCGEGFFCDGGLDFERNECRRLLPNNAGCAVVDGGRTCLSGRCQWGRCFEPGSVRLGGTCFVNDACKVGQCSSINGTQGQCVCSVDEDCGDDSVCKKGVMGIGLNQCAGYVRSSCPTGWKHDVRKPLNRDRCTRTSTVSAPLECKLGAFDNASNWTGPHAQRGEDECRSKKGKSPKGVKCPGGFKYAKRAKGDVCTKENVETRTPGCPVGYDYKSVSGWDMCEEKI